MKTLNHVQITEAQEGPAPPLIHVRLPPDGFHAGKWYFAHSQTRELVDLAALTLGPEYVRHCATNEALSHALAKFQDLRRAGTPLRDALRLAAAHAHARCPIPQ